MADRAAGFTFVWAIENASALRFADYVMSPLFSAKSLETTTWQLGILPLEFTRSAINVEVWRLKDEDGPENTEIDFELSFLSADGLLLTKEAGSKIFSRYTYHAIQFSQIDEILDGRKGGFSLNNVLMVRCRMWKRGLEMVKPEICFARTRIIRDGLCFVWSIVGFNSLQPGQKRKWVVNSTGGALLILSFFLTKESDTEFVCIEIDYGGLPGNPWAGEISLLDAGGAVAHRMEIPRLLYSAFGENVWISSHFFEKQKLISCQSNLLPNDVLYLRCEFAIFREHSWNEIENCEQLDFPQLTPTNLSEMADSGSETSDEEDETCAADSKDNNITESTKRETLCSLIWAIEKASALRFTGHVCSPDFTVKCMEMTKWHMCIENGKYFRLGLYGKADDDEDDRKITSLELEFEVSILGVDGLPLKKMTYSYMHRRGHVSWVLLVPNCLIYGNRKAEFLPNDVLTVRCQMWRNNTDIPEPTVYLAHTRFVKDCRFFFCTVTGFSSLQLGQKRIVETDFEEARKLVVSLYLTESDFKEYVCVDIDCSAFEICHTLEGEIALLDAEGGVVHFEKVQKYISETSENVYTFYKFFEKQKLLCDKSKLLPNDDLNLRCELSVYMANNKCVVVELQSEELDSSEPMSMHMGEMSSIKSDIIVDEANKSVSEKCPFMEIINEFYNESTLTDIVLQTSSKSFRVHKVVLSCRSAVFASMLAEDAHGETKHCFDIPDVDADTLQQLLLYIYTNEVPEVQWEGAVDLLRVANTYELLELKQKCAEILKMNISRFNLWAVLQVAYMSQEDELLKVVLEFLSENPDVFKSQEWKSFKNLNSECAMETMERVIYYLTDCIR